ncbi:hypothetical protein Dsin_015246 [Dipteronia sinensis]|uniref:Uncharacterized protein n=1 Tax=Dipteronia sinensis TaxID=43782 RepID=A0AAE0AAZ5_9ROSI|nr:hypothetical protein Dsin_015246 [Dipteronia sinensis]
MSLSVIEPANLQKFNLLVGENYDLKLTQSIQNLVAEKCKKTPNFTHFIDIFYELMQSKVEPPLESIWVYSALTFRSRNLTNDNPLDRLSAARDLFQLISACSGSCNSSKSIALLAPVVFEVYKVVVELKGRHLGSKREKKVFREVKSLVDVILGFISVCCCDTSNGKRNVSEVTDLNLIVSFKDLVSLWMEKSESFKSFLPLVNDEICREGSERVCDVNYLAGMVIVEVFLLKLCLSFGVGMAGVDLEKDLTSWAVSSITGFQNVFFFETLVRMLLEPTLPVTSLLSSEHGVLLKKVLYDAVILVEYSFLNPESAVDLPVELMKSLAMTRLIVTHEAIELLREDGDQKKAISYASAFSSSKLPSQIIKWITNQIGMDEKERSLVSSPKALLKWLLSLENQGIRAFDDKILKSRAKLAVDNSKTDYEYQSSKVKRNEASGDLLFYIDNKGEDEDEEDEEMNESMSAAFVAAAHSMKLPKNGGRKRKEMGSAGNKKKIKYPKHDLSDNHGSTREGFSSVSNEDLSSESEVDDPISDEDAEAVEQ